MDTFDVIVIGGGAAGLMCAAVAGGRGKRVLLIEGSNKIGKKILMSGGGRCNFTNLNTSAENFISANPHFCKSALSRYTPYDFVALVDAHKIPYHEKTAGQLFCDNSSKDILAMLHAECVQAGVEIVTHCRVGAVETGTDYSVKTDQGRFFARSLVIATGGLSIPKMGASDFGYRLARQFGLDVLDTRAGLVPFTLGGAENEMSERLSGVSTSAQLSSPARSFSEDILFTHRGLSGPGALQLSSYWNPGESISVQLLPQSDIEQLLMTAKSEAPRKQLHTVMSTHLPRALVGELQALYWSADAERPMSEFSNNRLAEIASRLGHWLLKPSGTEGYRTAEVTLGGVDTDELSSQSMESTKQPRSYWIGELVDVTGHLGGHNFQWAWASAQAAGKAV